MTSQHRRLYQVSEEKKKSIYDYIQRYAVAKYDIRYDQISQDFQISFRGKNNWEEFESNSFLVELAQNGMVVTAATRYLPEVSPCSEV